MASRVTMLFARTSCSSSSGTAVISFDLSSTQRCPSTRPWALAQALTTCRGDCSRPRANERRIVLPSMKRDRNVITEGYRHHLTEAYPPELFLLADHRNLF